MKYKQRALDAETKLGSFESAGFATPHDIVDFLEKAKAKHRADVESLRVALQRMQVERDVLWVALRGFGAEKDGEWHADECTPHRNGECGYGPCRGARVALAGVPFLPQPEGSGT
jgi:hypothetical protein